MTAELPSRPNIDPEPLTEPERDLPEAMEGLKEAGIEVRLAEPYADGTYPNEYPVFPSTTDAKGKPVKDFEHLPEEPAPEAFDWPTEEEPAWPQVDKATAESVKAVLPPQNTGRTALKETMEANTEEDLPRLDHYEDLPDPPIGGVTALGYLESYGGSEGEVTQRRDPDQPDQENFLSWEDDEIQDIAGVRSLAQGFIHSPQDPGVSGYYRSEANTPYRAKQMQQDGRAFLAYGKTSYGTPFTVLSFPRTSREKQQLSFVVRGEGRSFEQVLRLAERDFPSQFASMAEQGVQVKLAEPVELGDGTIGWPRIGKDGDPLLPIVYIKRSADNHGYESVRSVLPPSAT
jgi:hypothetical protein